MKRDDYFLVHFDHLKSSIIFKGSHVNWLEPKIEPPLANLACPNP